MHEYTPIITGTPLALVNPISDMEHDMINKYNIDQIKFTRWNPPHGYASVQDNQGVTWIVHPEALAPHPDTPPEYNIKVRACYDPRPENIPPGWIVFNAPRPILGSHHPQTDERLEWTGDFLSGRFWTATRPDDLTAIMHNRDMDAVIVLFIQDPAKTYSRLLHHLWSDRPDMLKRIDPVLKQNPPELNRQDLARKIADMTLDQWQAVT